MLRPQGGWLPALWLWPWLVATVVLEFPWCQFLLWPLVLPRLLAHVSPKRESLFLEEESVTQPLSPRPEDVASDIVHILLECSDHC